MNDDENAAPVVATPKKARKTTSKAKAQKGKAQKGKAKGKKGAKPVLTEDARLYRNGYSRGYKGYDKPDKTMGKAYLEGFAAGAQKGGKRKKPLP